MVGICKRLGLFAAAFHHRVIHSLSVVTVKRGQRLIISNFNIVNKLELKYICPVILSTIDGK